MQFCRGLAAVGIVIGFSIQCAVAQQFSQDQSGQYFQSQQNNGSAYPAYQGPPVYQRAPASQPPQGYRSTSANQYQQRVDQQQAYPPQRGPQNVAPRSQPHYHQPTNRTAPPQVQQQDSRGSRYEPPQRATGDELGRPATRSASNEFRSDSGQYQPRRPVTPSDQAQSSSGGSFQAQEAEPATVEAESAKNDQPGEEDSTEPVAENEQPVTAAEIEAAIKATKDSDASEEEKKSQLDYLTKATKWMESAKEYETKAVQYQVDVREAPNKLDQAKQELDKEMPEPTCEREGDASLPQLEQALGNAEEALKKAQEKLKKQVELSDAKIRGERKAKLDNDRENAVKQLEATQNELKAVTSSDDAPGLAAAQRIELQTRSHAYKKQIELYDAQKLRFEAMSELFPIERDLAQRDVTWHEKSVAAWQEVVTEFRNAESERQAAEARRIASRAHPAVKSLAERNAELAEERQQLTRKMEDVTGYLDSASKTLEALEKDYKSVIDKVEVAGMTPTIGLLLRSRRDWLPDVELHDERITLSQEEMQRAQVALLELKSERSESGDVNEQLKQTLAELGDVAKEFPPSYFEEMVRVLLEDRRTYLDNLLADYQSYHDDLSDLYLDSRKLLAKTETYRNYIDEHVLWIPSSPPLGGKDLKNSWVALTSFANAKRWTDVLRSTGSNVKEHPLASLLLVFAFVALLVLRRRIRNRLEALGERIAEANGLTFLPTLQAFLLTMLVAGLWPLLFWIIGWWMALNGQAPDLALGLAKGFESIAILYFVGELFRQICRPNGLADKHFQWSGELLTVIYRSLNWLMLLSLPMLFFVSLFQMHEGGLYAESLGRIVFLGGLIVLAVYLHLVLRPWNGPLQKVLSCYTNSWMRRLRYPVYLLGIGFPIVLSVLLVLGYAYSVDQLMLRMRTMIGLALALILAQALISRALQVAWNRLRTLRASYVPRRKISEGSQGEEEQDHEVDMLRVHRQLVQLVRGSAVLTFAVVAWLTWSDMFPALQVFDRVELWSTTITADKTVTLPDGTEESKQVAQSVPITLADMILAIVALVGTFAATRTLPGLLQLSILGRLPIDDGARHAIVALSRYLAMLIGLIVSFRMIGMTWASVQWLAAAMTVGLGFGLQEIFANLVSGIIILFERPIRIGDLVTVNGTTGKVTKMKIRATTITDFDRRETVVPNKRFITDDVVNWTLSDPISRVVIPVGIAYGCDPARAHEILLNLAHRHPLILSDPEPTAIFTGFGDSTLDLELRAFIGSREHFGTVLHELNLAIERAFREADLEIAFPQRDINIRSVTGLEQLLGRPKDETNTADEPKPVESSVQPDQERNAA